MILTCPACGTKYVVKDGAIPPQGRQVRCASCKHSWHQDPELTLSEPATTGEVDFGGPPPPPSEPTEQPTGEVPPRAAAEGEIAAEIQGDPQLSTAGDFRPGAIDADRTESIPAEAPAEPGPGEAAPVSEEWGGQSEDPQPAAEEEFVGYAPMADDEEPPRRRWLLVLAIIVLIAAAAAAFWFLAPPEWKQKAGIAEAGATPLQLMITTSDRQPLQSGNELVAISGRVINPTDKEQQVPPIQAELRDKETRKLVHRWTIQPPARVLAPRSSASFNSAEVDVPKGGDELTVTLGSGTT